MWCGDLGGHEQAAATVAVKNNNKNGMRTSVYRRALVEAVPPPMQ
jgi:hypothetical protein